MKRLACLLPITPLLACLVSQSLAADSLVSSMGVYVFPAQNQTSGHQSADDAQCFDWAKKQTGYDPVNPPQVVVAAPDQGPSGTRLRGAARGAAAGAIVSEITDNDTSDAMAAGATLGTLRGGRQSRHQKQQQAQQAEQAADQQAEANEGQFKGAYAACMEGNGYSVKY